MILTAQQNTTLKNFIAADPVLSTFPANGDGDFEIATRLNQLASPAFQVWNSKVQANDIYDAIIWANLTPAQANDGSQAWLNRTMLCQSKQINIQTLLQGREIINAAKANLRAGLQDSLTAIPSTSTGTN